MKSSSLKPVLVGARSNAQRKIAGASEKILGAGNYSGRLLVAAAITLLCVSPYRSS